MINNVTLEMLQYIWLLTTVLEYYNATFQSNCCIKISSFALYGIMLKYFLDYITLTALPSMHQLAQMLLCNPLPKG